MTLTDRLARRQEQRAMGTLGSFTNQSIVDPAAIPPPGMGGTTAAGMLVNETTVLTIDVVNTALHILTQGITKRGNLRAYNETIGPAGQTQKSWLTTPDPFLEDTFAFSGPASNSQSRGRAQMVVSLALFGESWLYKLTTNPRSGATSSVQVLHPLLLRENKSTNGQILAWEYGSGQNKIELDPANLYHVERMSLPNHDRALSNIREASVTYGIALAAMQYTSLWFGQGAQVPYLLTADAEISEDVAQRLAQRFRVEHSGLRQFHIPMVSGSNVKVNQIGTNADDAQMLETLQYVRTCIGAMFAIPVHLLGGIGDRNTWGANYEEVAQQMEDFTFAAYVVPIQEAHSDLLPGSLKAAWPTSLVQPNALNLGNALQFMRQAQVLTPNEARAMYLDLPPLDGGDDLVLPLASNTAPEQTDNTAEMAERAEDTGGSNDDDYGPGNQ